MPTDNDKQFDAMMSTLFECADMNTEDLEEFADEYLARLRADAEYGKRVREVIDQWHFHGQHDGDMKLGWGAIVKLTYKDSSHV